MGGRCNFDLGLIIISSTENLQHFNNYFNPLLNISVLGATVDSSIPAPDLYTSFYISAPFSFDFPDTLGDYCHIWPLFEVTVQLRTVAVLWTLFWCG